jgi:hypothetical protein
MKFEIHFEFRASLRKFQDLNFWDATLYQICSKVALSGQKQQYFRTFRLSDQLVQTSSTQWELRRRPRVQGEREISNLLTFEETWRVREEGARAPQWKLRRARWREGELDNGD